MQTLHYIFYKKMHLSILHHHFRQKKDRPEGRSQSDYNEIAPLGQTSAQVPHSVQISGLIL